MPIDIDKIIRKIQSGEYSRNNLEVLRKNALKKGGADSEKVVSACSEELEKSKPKNNKKLTNSELGIATVWWLAKDV